MEPKTREDIARVQLSAHAERQQNVMGQDRMQVSLKVYRPSDKPGERPVVERTEAGCWEIF